MSSMGCIWILLELQFESWLGYASHLACEVSLMPHLDCACTIELNLDYALFEILVMFLLHLEFFLSLVLHSNLSCCAIFRALHVLHSNLSCAAFRSSQSCCMRCYIWFSSFFMLLPFGVLSLRGLGGVLILPWFEVLQTKSNCVHNIQEALASALHVWQIVWVLERSILFITSMGHISQEGEILDLNSSW